MSLLILKMSFSYRYFVGGYRYIILKTYFRFGSRDGSVVYSLTSHHPSVTTHVISLHCSQLLQDWISKFIYKYIANKHILGNMSLHSYWSLCFCCWVVCLNFKTDLNFHLKMALKIVKKKNKEKDHSLCIGPAEQPTRPSLFPSPACSRTHSRAVGLFVAQQGGPLTRPPPTFSAADRLTPLVSALPFLLRRGWLGFKPPSSSGSRTP
jgi:hypothetical protein